MGLRFRVRGLGLRAVWLRDELSRRRCDCGTDSKPLLGGSRGLVSQVIGTATAVASNYNYSHFCTTLVTKVP